MAGASVLDTLQADRDIGLLEEWMRTEAYDAFCRVVGEVVRKKKLDALQGDGAALAGAQGEYRALAFLVGDQEFGRPGYLVDLVNGRRRGRRGD